MKPTYRIEFESYTYTYRSYMACEDQGEDDCVGRGFRWNVFRGKRKLKSCHSDGEARSYIKKLHARRKKREQSHS